MIITKYSDFILENKKQAESILNKYIQEKPTEENFIKTKYENIKNTILGPDYEYLLGTFLKIFLDDVPIHQLKNLIDQIKRLKHSLPYLRIVVNNNVYSLPNIIEIYSYAKKYNFTNVYEVLTDGLRDLEAKLEFLRWLKEFPTLLKKEYTESENSDVVKNIISLLNSDDYINSDESTKKSIWKSYFNQVEPKGKISRFKTLHEFMLDLKSRIDGGEWDFNLLIDNISELKGANIVTQNSVTGVIIVNIRDYYTSTKLGSKSWCISYSEYHWNNYNGTSKKNKQYFIYDTSLDKNDDMSMIGVTVNYDGSYYAIHRKDDGKVVKEKLLDVLKKLKISPKILAPITTKEIKLVEHQIAVEKNIKEVLRYDVEDDERFKIIKKYLKEPFGNIGFDDFNIITQGLKTYSIEWSNYVKELYSNGTIKFDLRLNYDTDDGMSIVLKYQYGEERESFKKLFFSLGWKPTIDISIYIKRCVKLHEIKEFIKFTPDDFEINDIFEIENFFESDFKNNSFEKINYAIENGFNITDSKIGINGLFSKNSFLFFAERFSCTREFILKLLEMGCKDLECKILSNYFSDIEIRELLEEDKNTIISNLYTIVENYNEFKENFIDVLKFLKKYNFEFSHYYDTHYYDITDKILRNYSNDKEIVNYLLTFKDFIVSDSIKYIEYEDMMKYVKSERIFLLNDNNNPYEIIIENLFEENVKEDIEFFYNHDPINLTPKYLKNSKLFKKEIETHYNLHNYLKKEDCNLEIVKFLIGIIKTNDEEISILIYNKFRNLFDYYLSINSKDFGIAYVIDSVEQNAVDEDYFDIMVNHIGKSNLKIDNYDIGIYINSFKWVKWAVDNLEIPKNTIIRLIKSCELPNKKETIDLIQKMISKGCVLINTRYDDSENVLKNSIKKGCLLLVKWLISEGISYKIQKKSMRNENVIYNLLDEACESNSLDMIEFILSKGFEFDQVKNTKYTNNIQLLKIKSLDVLKYCLDHIDKNQKETMFSWDTIAYGFQNNFELFKYVFNRYNCDSDNVLNKVLSNSYGGDVQNPEVIKMLVEEKNANFKLAYDEHKRAKVFTDWSREYLKSKIKEQSKNKKMNEGVLSFNDFFDL